MVQVTVPVGAAKLKEPVIKAVNVMGCPTVGLLGEVLTNIVGVVTPRVREIAVEVAVT
jgi:hypothetical protein